MPKKPKKKTTKKRKLAKRVKRKPTKAPENKAMKTKPETKAQGGHTSETGEPSSVAVWPTMVSDANESEFTTDDNETEERV